MYSFFANDQSQSCDITEEMGVIPNGRAAINLLTAVFRFQGYDHDQCFELDVNTTVQRKMFSAKSAE